MNRWAEMNKSVESDDDDFPAYINRQGSIEEVLKLHSSD